MSAGAWSMADSTTGRFVGIQFAGDDADLKANTPEGCTAVPGRIDHTRYRLNSSGEVEPLPLDLAELKAQMWERTKAEREMRLAGTFVSGGRVFEVDRDNIPGAALDALRAQLASEAWTQAWVLADNSVVTLDGAQMIAAARAMKDHIAALWATSQTLRAQIEAATSADELAAIAWPD